MILIIGLGNPGREYEKTRHNLGFMVLDELLRRLTPVEKTKWRLDNNLISQLATHNLTPTRSLVLAKPQTSMNVSGEATKKLIDHFGVVPSQIWVVHDDIDLPLGRIKINKGRGSAGHRGVESIIRHLETCDFYRFRLGAGQPTNQDKLTEERELTGEKTRRDEVVKHVLEIFEGKQAVEAGKMIDKAVKAIIFALQKGIDKAQSRFY